MKNFRRTVSIILTMVMLVGMVTVGPFTTASAASTYYSHGNSTNLDSNNGDIAAYRDETGVDMRDWDQRDYRWNNYALGINGTCNVGHAGCTCTAITKLMIESGLAAPTELNPGKLIRWMDNNEGFSGSNILWGYPEKFANEVLGKQWWYRSVDVFQSTSGANSDYVLLKGTTPLYDGNYTYNDDLLGYMFQYSGTGYHQIIKDDSTGYSLQYQDIRLSMLIQAGYHLVITVHNSGSHWVAIDETATRNSGTSLKNVTINNTTYSIPVYNTFYVMNSWYGSSGDGTNSRDTLQNYLNARSDDSNRGRFMRAAAYSTNPVVMYTLTAESNYKLTDEEKLAVTNQYSTDHFEEDLTPAESNDYKAWSNKDYRWACAITSYPTASINGNKSNNTESSPAAYGTTENNDSLIELMGEWGQSIVCLDKALIQAGLADASYYPAVNDSYRARKETYLTDQGQTGNLLGDLNEKKLITETGGVISWTELSTLNSEIKESGAAYTNAGIAAGSAASTAMIANMRDNGYHYVINLEKGSTADNAWVAVDEATTLNKNDGNIYILGCTADTSQNVTGTTLAAASTALTGTTTAYRVYYFKMDVNADKFQLTYSADGATLTAKDGDGNAIASGSYVDKGTNVIFTASDAATGRTLASGSWKVNGTDGDLSGTTVSMQFSTTNAQNVVYTAGWQDYKVTATGEHFTLTGTTSYHYGDAASVTITPADGYSVTSVSADGISLTKSGTTYSFTMPAENVVLSVETNAVESDYRRWTDNGTHTKGSAVAQALIEIGVQTTSDYSVSQGTVASKDFSESNGDGWSSLSTSYSGKITGAGHYAKKLNSSDTPATTGKFTGTGANKNNYYTELKSWGTHMIVKVSDSWYCIDRDMTLATGQFYVMADDIDNSIPLNSVLNGQEADVFYIETGNSSSNDYLSSNYHTFSYTNENSSMTSAVFSYTEKGSTISGSVANGGYLKNGATVALTAAPATGYEATAKTAWSPEGTDGTHAAITMGGSDISLTHTATAKQHSVTFAGSQFTATVGDNITESSGKYSFTYADSGNCTFTLEPDDGYVITSVTATGAELTPSAAVTDGKFVVTYSFPQNTDCDVTISVETEAATDYRGWNGTTAETNSFVTALAQALTAASAGGKTIWTVDDTSKLLGLDGYSVTESSVSSSFGSYKNLENITDAGSYGDHTEAEFIAEIKRFGSYIIMGKTIDGVKQSYLVDRDATLAINDGSLYVSCLNSSGDYNIMKYSDLVGGTFSYDFAKYIETYKSKGTDDKYIDHQTAYYPVTYSTEGEKALIGGDFIWEDSARNSTIGGDFVSGGYLPKGAFVKITGTPKLGYEPAATPWTNLTENATSGSQGKYTCSFRNISDACAATYAVSPIKYSISYPVDDEGFYYVENKKPTSADYQSTAKFQIALFNGYSISDVTATYGDTKTSVKVTKDDVTATATYSGHPTGDTHADYSATVYSYSLTMPADDVTVSFTVTNNNTTKTIHLETDSTNYSGGIDNYEDGEPVWYIWTFDDPTVENDNEVYGRWIKGEKDESGAADWSFEDVGKYFRIYRYEKGSVLGENGVPTGELWNYTYTTIESSGGDVYKFTAFNRGVNKDIFGEWIGDNIYLYPKAWEITGNDAQNKTTVEPPVHNGYYAYTYGDKITEKWIKGTFNESTGCYEFVGVGQKVIFVSESKENQTEGNGFNGWQTYDQEVDIKNSGDLFVLNDRYSSNNDKNKIEGYWAKYEDFDASNDFTTWTKDNARWSDVRLGSSATTTETSANWPLSVALAKLVVQAGNKDASKWDVTDSAYKLFNNNGVFLFSNEATRKEMGFDFYRFNDSSKSGGDHANYLAKTDDVFTINYGSGTDSSGTYDCYLMSNYIAKDGFNKYNYAMLINGYHFIFRIDHKEKLDGVSGVNNVGEYVTVDEAMSLVSGELYVWRSVNDQYDDNLTPSANGSYNLLDLMKAINGGTDDYYVDETKVFGMSDKSGHSAEYDYRYWSRYDNRWRSLKMGDYDYESQDRMSYWGALVASFTKMMKQCGVKGWKYIGTGTTEADYRKTENWEESYDYTIFDVLMYMKYITRGFNDSDQNSIVWIEMNGAFGKKGSFEWANVDEKDGTEEANKDNYFYLKNADGSYVQYAGKDINFVDTFDTTGNHNNGYAYTEYKDTLMALIKDGYHLLIRANTHDNNQTSGEGANLGTWVAVEEKLSINSDTLYVMDSQREVATNVKTLESFLKEDGTGRNGKFIRVVAYKGGSTYIKTDGEEDKPQDEVVEILPEVREDIDDVTGTALLPYAKDPAYCGANIASGHYNYVYGTTYGDVTLRFSGAILGKTYRYALFDNKEEMQKAIDVFNAGLDYSEVTYSDAVCSAANTNKNGLMSINIYDAVDTNSAENRGKTLTKYVIVQLVEPDTEESTKVNSKSNVIWTTMNYQTQQLTTGFDQDREIEVKQSDFKDVTVGDVTKKGIDLSEYLRTSIGGTAYANAVPEDKSTYISGYSLSYSYYEVDQYLPDGKSDEKTGTGIYFLTNDPGTYIVTLTAVGDTLTRSDYEYHGTAENHDRTGLEKTDKRAPLDEKYYVSLGTYRTIKVTVLGEVDYTYVDNENKPHNYRVENVSKHGKVEFEWGIPTKVGYIFTGWYYDDQCKNALKYDETVDEDHRSDNSINNIVKPVTTVYAGWVAIGKVEKDPTDTNVLPSDYEGKYKGFDMPGVQLRKEGMSNPNMGEAIQPGGLRFITSLNETMLSGLNKACTKVEYGYVVAKDTGTTSKWIKYHDADGRKLLYKSKTANGVDTTAQQKDTYFNFVTNVDCTSGTDAVKDDHKTFTGYRLYSMVITYENADDQKGIHVVARPYIRYDDANGKERVAYSDYGGTPVCGGCSASYSLVAGIAETAMK